MQDYLNHTIDAAAVAVAANFEAVGRVVVPDFLQADFAAAIVRELLEEEDWNLVFRDNNRHYDLHRIQWQALTDDNYCQLRDRIIAVSQQDFQYWFYNIPMYDMVAEGRSLSPNLQKLYQLFQSPEFIALMRQFTDVNAVEFADCQATRYTEGCFLTTHDDEVGGKNRHVAYVLGLTQDWRADWGGLLTFPAEETQAGEYFLPGFNSLSLFSVPQSHFVGMVNPMAQRARLSITGWLRSHSSKL